MYPQITQISQTRKLKARDVFRRIVPHKHIGVLALLYLLPSPPLICVICAICGSDFLPRWPGMCQNKNVPKGAAAELSSIEISSRVARFR